MCVCVCVCRDQKEADLAAATAAKEEAETSTFARQVAAIKADCQKDLDEVGRARVCVCLCVQPLICVVSCVCARRCPRTTLP